MPRSSDLFRKREQDVRRKPQPPMGSNAHQEDPEREGSASVSTENPSPKDSGPAPTKPLSGSVPSPTAPTAPTAPATVEHRVLRRETLIPERDLNLLGDDGWELVTALPVPMRLGEESLFFFKRRKEKESPR